MHSLKIILIIFICSLLIYSEIGFLKFLGIFVLIFVFLYLFLLAFMPAYDRVLFPDSTHHNYEIDQDPPQKSFLNQRSKIKSLKNIQVKLSTKQQFKNFKDRIYPKLDPQNQAYLDEIEIIFQDIEYRQKTAKFSIPKKLNRQLQLAQSECLKHNIRLFNTERYNKNTTFDQQTLTHERHKIIENLLKKIEFLYQNDLQSLLNHQHFLQQNLDVKQVFKLKQNTKRIWQNDE